MDFNIIAVVSTNEKCFIKVVHFCQLLACDLQTLAQAINAPCGTLLTGLSTRDMYVATPEAGTHLQNLLEAGRQANWTFQTT